MDARGMELRINDLKKWPSQTLKRRMRFGRDMELALVSVGSAAGFHHFFLLWDELVIKEILEKRSNN